MWLVRLGALALIGLSWAQSGPYYGLPVGSLFYTADGTKGDIYASDPRTIMAVKFKQAAREGCTSFMAGPGKGGDEGVMLPVRVRSGDLRIVRSKRGVKLGAGFPWGVAAFASLNAFSPMGNLRMPDDAPAPPTSAVSFDGIDLDVDADEAEGWFQPTPLNGDPAPIGPAMPPHLKPTTEAPVVTRISVPAFPKAKKMMPIGEIMKMRAKSRAEIPPKEAAVVEEPIEEEQSTDDIIVFNPEDTANHAPVTIVPVMRSKMPSSSRRQSRPATRRPRQRRPNNTPIRRPNAQRRRGQTTTDRPRRRFTFPPAHLLPGYTPTASYRNREGSRRRQTRPTPPPTNFRVVRRRTTVARTRRTNPTTTREAVTTTRPTNPTTTFARSTTTTPEIVSTTLIPLKILPNEDRPVEIVAEETVRPVVHVSEEIASSEEAVLPVIKTGEERPSIPFIRFHPTIPPPSANESSIGNDSSHATVGGSSAEIGNGLIMVDLESNSTVEAPSEVHPSFRKPLPRHPEFYERSEDDVILFHSSRANTQPPTTIPTTASTTTESTTLPPTTATEAFSVATATTQDPEAANKISLGDLVWHVVEDPRANRRKPTTTVDPEAPTPLPNSDALGSTTTVEPPPELPSPAPGSIYALPEIQGETLLIEIPEDYELNDFEWFGVYDHCKKTRTAFVSLKDVRAPEEAVLEEGIKGWQFETASRQITVINCNTIRLDGFTFTGHNHTNSYVYVGTGDFPDRIQQHVQAAVIGQREDEPLRNYRNEDVLIKLPQGWKTFDIDFVSIFNPAERTSYGHATIPPLVVPPCEDVFAP